MSDRGLRAPLARVRGLGSAKEGTQHWWMQRVTAIALVPLVIWFAASIVSVVGADHATIAAWLARPLPGLMMILFLATSFYHLMLGLQVVIEDYVADGWSRVAGLLAMKFACIALGLASILAVLRFTVGGS